MSKIEISTVINRPVEEVFEVVSNVEHNPKRFSSFLEVQKTSRGHNVSAMPDEERIATRGW